MIQTAKLTAPRRLEFREGSSSKFWEIHREGQEVVIQFGRIGTRGQIVRKPFPTTAAAEQHLQQLIGQKTAKGYVEVSGS